MAGIDAAAGGSFEKIVMDLLKDGHVSDRTAEAVLHFLTDLRAAARTPRGLVADYLSDRISSGSPGAAEAYSNARDMDAWSRTQHVFCGLSVHERRILNACIVAAESGRSPLVHVGRAVSRFNNAKSCKAYGVASVVGLCERILALHEATPSGRTLRSPVAA